MTFTVTANNAGTAATDGSLVTVTDTLPANLTATAVSGTGWTCPSLVSPFSCTRTDVLANGSSYPAITVTATVAGGAVVGSTLTNNVTVGGGGQTNLANDSASDAITVAGTPDLTVSKTHTAGTFIPGSSVTFTVTANNVGTAATTGTLVTVTDTLPANLTATAVSGTGWTCPSLVSPFSCTRTDVLANGSSYPAITVTATVAGGAVVGSTLTNNVSVGGGGQTNLANDTASDAITVSGVPDMTVSKTHTGNFSQGQTAATYTITATNVGTTVTTGTVTVVDTLPAGLTATAISGNGWSCTLGTLTCTRNDALAVSAAYPVITVTVNVSTTAGSPLTNTAVVSGGGETNLANDTATDPTVITPIPDVTISKAHVGSFSQGQVGATYTLAVSNVGGTATTAPVSVVDTLPGGMTATAISGTGWNCTLGTLTCTRADALGASASYPNITVTVNIANNATTPLTNTAVVSGGGETNLTNDTATDPTAVGPTPDMTISKSHTGNFTQGQIGATYAINVSNVGGATSTGLVTVVDTLPVGLTATAMAGGGWTCTVATLTCTRNDGLAVSAAYPPITVTVNVANNSPFALTNTAVVSGGGEANLANDTATDPTTVNGVPDVTILKSHAAAFGQGQAGTFTLLVSNVGTAATTGAVNVADALPAGMTATAISGTGWTCTVGTVSCTRADALAVASSYPAITVTVNVALNATGTLTNTATVAGGGETNLANDTSSDAVLINTAADLTITKTHTGNFTQGQTGATFTLTVTNVGASGAAGTVNVTDSLPAGLTATALAGTGWICNVSTASCLRADALAPGASFPPITVTVDVALTATGTLTNNASVSGGGDVNPANNNASDAVVVSGVPDLTIAKSHSGVFTLGQTGATYSLTVSNVGVAPTSGTVSVSDGIPTGLSLTGMSGAGWSCSGSTCSRSDVLAAGAAYPAITVTVDVAANAPASLVNTASVSGGGEKNTSNNNASDPTTVNGAPDLTISKTHDGNFRRGQTGAAYTLNVSNVGNVPTSGTVSVSDSVPSGLSLTGMSGAGWNCSGSTCSRSDVLAAGGSYPAITVTVDVSLTAPLTLVNTATVGGGNEKNTSNNSASDPTTIQGPDLTISKSHSGALAAGKSVAYTITVSNVGPVPTVGAVSVADAVPAGLTITNMAGAGWACGLGSCSRNDVLAAGGSYPAITVTADIAPTATGALTNTATVSGGGDTNPNNNSASDTGNVSILPDLTIGKTHTGNFALGQQGAAYTISVSNVGGSPTSAPVTVTDGLPAGLTATAIAGTGWTCTLSPLSCTRADVLDAGQSYPAITVTVNVAPTAGASLTNTATVSGGGETNTANNSASDTTTITGAPDLTITKTHPSPVAQGQKGLVYTLTVTNGGSVATSGTVTVVDTLPASLTATAISGSGWTCTLATVTCTRADVLAPAGVYPPISLTVDVAGNTPLSIVNTAVVSGGGEVNIANDIATDPTPITGAPALRLTKTHAGDFARGGTGFYYIEIANIGSVVTNGAVSVLDNLPQGLIAEEISGDGWTCGIATLRCARTDALQPGSAYPLITLRVTIGPNAPAVIINTATVSSGGIIVSTGGQIGGASGADSAAIADLTPQLRFSKVADRSFADPGEVVVYRIEAYNSTGSVLKNTVVNDRPPAGFLYVPGSARISVDGAPSKPLDTGNSPGLLVFNLGVMNQASTVVVTYVMRITAAARPGDNANSARISGITVDNRPAVSQAGVAGVRVGNGLLSARQFIIGRVFEDKNANGVFDKNERPIAGARVFTSSGQSANTDSKGMYNIPSVSPGSVVISLDPDSVPAEYTLYADRRHYQQSWSRLLRTPLGGGTMLRQNFPIVRIDPQTVVPAPNVTPEPAKEAFVQPATPVALPPTPTAATFTAAAPAMRLEVTPDHDTLSADGRSTTGVRIRLLDANGTAVPAKELRIKTSLGQFVNEQGITPLVRPKTDKGEDITPIAANGTIVPSDKRMNVNPLERDGQPKSGPGLMFGPGTSPQFGLTAEQVPERMQSATIRLTNGEAAMLLLSPNTPGIGRIEAETGDAEHRVTASTEIFFTPEKRSPILVGMGEIAIGKAAPEFGLYGQSGDVARRGDAFIRTPWKNSLYTFAYTSHLATNDNGGPRRMFQFDPLDRVYPVFGDSSTQYQVVTSNTHFYGRMDRNHSWVLFGDIRGDQAQQQRYGVSDFTRNLTGVQIHLEDRNKNSLTLQGARPNTGYSRDVFPGSTFGLIQLSHPDVLPGSENLTLEIRDRYNPEIVLSRQPLSRNVDYNLDWTTGAIFFLKSLNAYDQALNLVQVVASYEYRSVGFTSTVIGVKADKRFDKAGLRLQFGFTTQREASLGEYYLGSLAIEKTLPRNGHLKVELPVSYGSASAAGASSTLTGTPLTDVNGLAVRAELSQPLPVAHGELTASFNRTEDSFYNPFGATTMPGSQTTRVAVELSPKSTTRFKFGFTDEHNKTSLVHNQRQTGSLELKQSLTERLSLTANYDLRDFQNAVNGKQNRANEVSAGLDWRATDRFRASIRREQNLTSSDPTYPNQTLITGRYRMSDTVNLFATQRFSSAPILPIGDLSRTGFASLASKRETSIGIEDRWNKYTSVQGRYLVENGLNGSDSYAVLGLVNRIPVREHFNLDLGLEHGALITGKDNSFNSGSVGFSWLPNDSFKAASRYEIRDRGGFGHIYTAGAAGRVTDGMTVLGQFQHSSANFLAAPGTANIYSASQSVATQGMGAFAIRPLRRDSEALMFSYTLRVSDLTGLQGGQPTKDKVGILSTDGYIQPTRSVEFYGKFAMSDRSFNYSGLPTISTNTYLWDGRTQIRLATRFDVAAEGRYLRQPVTNLKRGTWGIEAGFWPLADLRAGLGYNFKSADEISANFLTNPIRQGVYFVLTTKLSRLFDLFSSPARPVNDVRDPKFQR